MATNKDRKQLDGLGEYKYGFSDPEKYVFKSRKGLSREVVEEISWMKGEPDWMRQFRLKAYEHFIQRPMPNWGPDLSGLNFDDIYYYLKPTEQAQRSWDDVPEDIKRTFDRLGIPEAERKFLAGAGAMYESEAVYHNIQEELARQGVIFLSIEDGLKEHPELFRKYFGKLVPPGDNKFAALNSAVWSGGSFVYVPPGVEVALPLQAYFRVNAQSLGQFERTLIIADEGSYVHYIEGCTAPVYTTYSFHSGVIEIVARRGARMRYTTVQNWSNNMYNLVTQRSAVYGDATMEWVDANMGCLAQGSTVTTPDGLLSVEKLEVGDKVLSFDEASGQLCFRRVLAKRFSGYQPVHTVSLGERRLQVTANHPFYSYVYNPDAPKKLGRYYLAYVRADHLKEAIVPCSSLDYGKPHRLLKPSLVAEFDSRNQYADELTMTRELPPRLMDIEYTTDDIMWLFGYWLGDGNIQVKEGKTENMIRWAKVGFSTPVADRACAHLMNAMTMVIDALPTERADGRYISWNSKELAEFFRLNGFVGGARDKRVPRWVWSLPESQRLAFVAGYLDADGCTHEPRRLAAKSVNRALLEDVASLLVTLGITPRIYTEFDEPKHVTIMGIECVAHGSHRLDFPQDERLLPYLTPALRQRVEAALPAQCEYHRLIGRSNIELPGTAQVAKVQVSEPSAEATPTWDIEVEGTGNFISQGFIVHNSKLTMKYPACFLREAGARGEILSIAFAGQGQHQDTGGKMVHAAPHTRSKITSKSISKDGGRSSYRGLLKVIKGAQGAQSHVQCDALLLDEHSRTDTYPYIEIDEEQVSVGHEATVSKIGDEQLFYLTSRGLSELDARTMVVSGFIEPLVKELPMEYAVEMNRLIQLQMEGTVG